jgi:hypothetical protein
MGRRRDAQGAAGRGGFIGRRPRVWRARVGGEDSVQGHAASIRRASTAGRGGHGWRRPWGRRWRRPCLAPPSRFVTGRQGDRR